MTTPDEQDLLLAYLHRDLPAEAVAGLEARLKAEPALADALVMLAREESILTEWAHSSAGPYRVPDKRVTEPARPAAGLWRFRTATRWGAAAAVLVLAVWAAFRLIGTGNKPASEGVVVETVQGDVTLETTEGDVAAADGQAVLPGQVIRTGGDDSFAVLRYPDNTRLLLAAWTWVRVENPGLAVKGVPGKRMFVG